MVFEFYTWKDQKYVGIFSGKDWIEARRQASKATGIAVDDMIMMTTNETYYSLFSNYETE